MKFFYNCFENNYEELASYYPRFYRDVFEMTEIWKAHGSVLDELQAHIEQSFFNGFVLTADINIIRSYEQLLGLTGTEKLTLEERRRIVLSRIWGYGHIGQAEIKAIVSNFTDGEIDVDFNGRWFLDGSVLLNGKKMLTEGIIKLTVTRDLSETIPIVYARKELESRIPAHLMLEIIDRLNPIEFISYEKCLFYKFGSLSYVSSCNYKGRWYLNGEEALNGNKTFAETRTTQLETFGVNMPFIEIFERNAVLTETCEWTLNGEVLLNNNRKLAGIVKEEF